MQAPTSGGIVEQPQHPRKEGLREGLSSKTPLRNLTTNGCEPKVMLLGSTNTEESAERAVLIALYPKPALNRVARKSIPFSTVASNFPSCLDWQYFSQCLR